MEKRINNLKINNALLKAKKIGFTFALVLTPLALTGCNKKISETSIEKTIEQNKEDTYMDSIFNANKNLKKGINDLEKALSDDSENEKSKKYIMDNSQPILQEYLSALIKSSICDTKNESVNNYKNYIINYEHDKYDGERITISDRELYLVKDGYLKRLIYDYLNVIDIDETTDYNQIREIAVYSIEDSKTFISKYELEINDPSILTYNFDTEIDKEIVTKRRKK